MTDRHELRKAYEDLADDVLIEIFRNNNEDYEPAAVEVAKTVLDERGVNLSYLNDNSMKVPCGSGAFISGPFVVIPRFGEEESTAIEELFKQNRLTYEKHAVASVSCSGCGCSEYVFHVPGESFGAAVEVLKEYYLSGAEEGAPARFSGACPACGTELAGVEACTDCGLTLAVDHAAALEGHPFVRFLKQNNLL